MKKIYLIATLMLAFMSLKAQTRKHSANFPLYKQYYNPALTAFEGSAIHALHRSQWSSFEGAPSTFYLSAELSMSDILEWRDVATKKEKKTTAHAFGLSLLKDTFGPYYEHQMYLSYSSSLKISQAIGLRAGASLTYNIEGMDGSKMNLEQSNDPFVLQYMQNTRNGRVDVNLGLMLTGDNFYLGYALQDAAKGTGKLNNELAMIVYNYKHIVQGGYRMMVSDQLGLVTNGLYQYDQQRGGSVEGQLKAVLLNKFWVGSGYRNRLAYTFNLGLQLQGLQIGYAFEVATGDAQFAMQTNELMLSYRLGVTKEKELGNRLSIW